MKLHQEPFHTEKHLLSLWQCGCYIHTQNLITIGLALGIELPFKKRSSLLQTLLLYVKETKQEQRFLSLTHKLLEEKAHALQKHLAHYPKTTSLMNPWLVKIEHTQYLLTQEFALPIKDQNA